MSKNLILIGGPMGVGKTTVAKLLNQTIPHSALLDGDWCWQLNPFVVNEETKAMVMGNIHYLLNSFLKSSMTETVVFCWVMDEQSIIDSILAGLDLTDVRVHAFSLLADEAKLTRNIQADVKQLVRVSADLERSLARVEKYATMTTEHVDVSHLEPLATVQLICQRVWC